MAAGSVSMAGLRELRLATGRGYADTMRCVDGRAVGVLGARPEGHTLSGGEVRAGKYSTCATAIAPGRVGALACTSCCKLDVHGCATLPTTHDPLGGSWATFDVESPRDRPRRDRGRHP